jgi:hypothetical protein
MKRIQIIAAGTEVHKKHTNTLYGQNEEFLNVKNGGKKRTTTHYLQAGR